MIYKITLEVLKKGTIIPFSYQYPMSGWIYNLVHQSDYNFSIFIHNKGYEFNNKHFKMFSFSKLSFLYQQTKYGLKILSKNATFKISFLSNEVALNVITGLFNSRHLRLGKAYFKVKNVELVKTPITKECIRLKANSPIVIKNYKGKYLKPNEEDYEIIFENNLKRKYGIAIQKEWLPKTNLTKELSIQLLSKSIREKGIQFKHKKNKVIGYEYNFELTAPKVLIQTGLLAGFGSQNAQGFGFCEILKN